MIWATFLMGFLGSLHCLGMCGPIVLALPIKKNGLEGVLQNIIYQIGRISTYIIMGIFFGALGKGIKITGLHQFISILLGIIMILFVLIPQKNIKKYSSIPLAIFLSKIKIYFKTLFEKKTLISFFVVGLLNGFLPCGMVYFALAVAIESASIFWGGLGMLFFGLGTFPLMFFAVLSLKYISIKLREKLLKISSIFILLIGILFIARGLGIRIPKLAPDKKYLQILEKNN